MRLALAIILLAGLAACAKIGALDRPAPLFGEKAKAHYRAEQAAVQAAKAKAPEDQPEALPAGVSEIPPANAPTEPPPAVPQ